jgi:hypothetical protein
MTMEMCESLIASWLKHEHGCQIVQSNWKVSSMWEECISSLKDVEDIFVKLRKDFSDLNLEFTTNEMTVEQFIKQGEIDCVGIHLKFSGVQKLMVEKIHAVDVAFHENGLSYENIY